MAQAQRSRSRTESRAGDGACTCARVRGAGRAGPYSPETRSGPARLAALRESHEQTLATGSLSDSESHPESASPQSPVTPHPESANPDSADSDYVPDSRDPSSESDWADSAGPRPECGRSEPRSSSPRPPTPLSRLTLDTYARVEPPVVTAMFRHGPMAMAHRAGLDKSTSPRVDDRALVPRTASMTRMSARAEARGCPPELDHQDGDRDVHT